MEASKSAVYRQTTWQDILEAADLPAELRSFLDVRSDGVWVIDAGHPDLNWHPLRELNDPVENDPRQKPHLPFPFSARDLAAFLIGSLGYFIQIRFGEWEDGPDEAILECLPGEAIAAKDAIRKAYQAYREALAEVGSLDTVHAQRVNELRAKLDNAREQARAALGVKAMAKSPAYKKAKKDYRQADIGNDAAVTKWREKMVQHLLKPGSNGNSPGLVSRVDDSPPTSGKPRDKTESAQPARDETTPALGRVHSTNRRTNALRAVIEQAKLAAVDASDWANVWNELVKIAASDQRPAPLLGYTEGEGVKYQNDNEKKPVAFLTRQALRKRLSPRGTAKRGR
jgi:hypothetical protein